MAQTFLVDGLVAGTWNVERRRLRLTPFAPLQRSAHAAVEEEGARFVAWMERG